MLTIKQRQHIDKLKARRRDLIAYNKSIRSNKQNLHKLYLLAIGETDASKTFQGH